MRSRVVFCSMPGCRNTVSAERAVRTTVCVECERGQRHHKDGQTRKSVKHAERRK